MKFEDFHLLDIIGGASVSATHPTRPIIAYSSGCMIIVYDMLSDQKINLVHHEHEVSCLAFSPPGIGTGQSMSLGAGGEFLLSVDVNRNNFGDSSKASHSKLCLWQW